jgi:hypothetical protein
MATKSQSKVVKFLAKAMTVKDLIDELSFFDADSPVLIASDYGDIAHTQQLQSISSVDGIDEELEYVTESGYSNSDFALETLEDDEDLDDLDVTDELPVVIIRL